MSAAPSPATLLGDAGDTPINDQLYLRARLVDLCFSRVYDGNASGVWHAPCTLPLLGGRTGGPTLSLTTHWRAMVGATVREDRTLRIHLLGSGDETVDLSLDDEGADAGAPSEAVAIATVLRTLARRGHLDRGVDLLRATDVPTGVGLGVDAAVLAAVARAVGGLSSMKTGAGPGPAELADALDEASGPAADHRICLSAPEGFAALAGSDSSSPSSSRSDSGSSTDGRLRQVRFDPAQHGFRLVLVTLRVAPRSPVPTVREPAEAEDALAEAAFDLLALATPADPAASPARAQPAGLPERLGALLDASHAAGLAGLGGREPALTDGIVTAARAAGAWGARTLSSRAVLAAVPTATLGTTRQAILAACAERPEAALGARFLTTAGVAGAGGEGADAIDRMGGMPA